MIRSFKQDQGVLEYYRKYGWKTAARDILYDLVGSFLFAMGVVYFADQAPFVPGGITGMAMIIHHFTAENLPGLGIGAIINCINIPIALFCFLFLGRVFFFKSVKSLIISNIFIDYLIPHLGSYPQAQTNPLLTALYGGALYGIGLALIYIPGSSTGGSDFVIMSIRKLKPHLSIGTISILVDGSVILLGGLVFRGDGSYNIDAVLYGILFTFVSTTMIDKLMYGSGSRRMLQVVSDKAREISQAIMAEINRGATLMDVKGAYTGQTHQMLMVVCSKVEITHARRIINSVDPKAIVLLSTVDEAYGKGFLDPDSN